MYTSKLNLTIGEKTRWQKKVSELTQINNLDNDDEFLVVDKSGKVVLMHQIVETSMIQLWQIKDAIGASGPKGDKGDQGQQGAT